MRRKQFLLLAALTQFALFIPVTIWANNHKHQPPLEVAITRLTQRKQSALSRHLVQAFDIALCSSFATNILAVPVAALLWRRQQRVEAIATLTTCWTSEFVRKLLKRSIQRPRPNPLLVHVTKPTDGSSFPSGDVASCVGLWGWLMALNLLAGKEKRPFALPFMSIPVLCMTFIGPARVYLGDHWTTDVLGGYLFGGGWLSLSLYAYLQLREHA